MLLLKLWPVKHSKTDVFRLSTQQNNAPFMPKSNKNDKNRLIQWWGKFLVWVEMKLQIDKGN